MATTPDSSSFQTSDGRTLAYAIAAGTEDGTRTLICHPGGPGLDGSYFGDLAGLGDGRIRIVALDPRGTGGSDLPPDGRYDLELYADDVVALADHLGLERLDYLGHSHGGFVGQQLALDHADRLDRLVLLTTSARFGPEFGAEVNAQYEAHRGQPHYDDAMAAIDERAELAGNPDKVEGDPAEIAGTLYARVVPLWFAPNAEAQKAAQPVMDWFRASRPSLPALMAFNSGIAPTMDFRARLPEITVPTLVLNGTADFFGPQTSAKDLAAIPSSRVVLIAGAGHFPWLDQPTTFRNELEDFLLRD
jgi:proline iminopeptidase